MCGGVAKARTCSKCFVEKMTNKVRSPSWTKTLSSLLNFEKKIGGGGRGVYKLCIMKWQRNTDQGSRLGHLLEQYRGRPVRTQLRQ